MKTKETLIEERDQLTEAFENGTFSGSINEYTNLYYALSQRIKRA